EGFTIEEILTLPNNEFDTYVFTEDVLLFKAGSSEILGRFQLLPDRLIIELAEIHGGGEGVLPTLVITSKKIAKKRGISLLEWRIHAVTCVNPNLKLRRVLEKRQFKVVNHEIVGQIYHKVESV
ncbi:MAG: hypothetical protein AAF490_26745, partial [Chloroflexota bacterium]